ncbi:DoxX family protein [Corynebacterium hansenii]|uniref:DoxX family protein n=1 Tax=Corynebacterium hansenii TaxID=394964 RepID=A0ABV7ZUT7_9CORY|nr:DoxX family protein [Corynebacterium hansenii]WJY99622.1 Putative oxidoreductase MhqP [Corynebacterium hansenii]
MSDNTKNPNPRKLGDYEEGLDDDFDVPTYRRIADDDPKVDVAPETRPKAADDAKTESIAVPVSKQDPEPDARTEIFDGTGAGPLAGSADGGSAAAAAATSGTLDDDPAETQVIPRRDVYAAAGRTAPQKIEPLDRADDYREADADFAADHDQPTQVAPAPTGYGDAAPEHPRDDALLDDATTPTAAAAAVPVAAGDPDFRDDQERDPDLDPRRGTLDLGLLLLRLGVGGMLLMLGLATFFQFGGAPGIGTLEAQFADNGYNYANVIAIAIPTIQVIAGGLLVLGLATPLGAALALAISAFLTMFEVAIGDSGWNVLAEGAEPVRLHLALTATALALQFTGPGRYGIDFSRGWARRPLASSWIFCALAIAAAVGLWYLTAGQLPFVNTTTGASI